MMNIYRLIGDVTHLIAIVVLLLWICKKKSCRGISGKTQLIHCIVFTLRYLDIFAYFISFYNTIMKFIFLTLTYTTTQVILVNYYKNYEANDDNMNIAFLIIPSIVLGLIFTENYSTLEVCWTISIELEAVAIIPQLSMSRYRGESCAIIRHYMLLLAVYKSMYCLNWFYKSLYSQYVQRVSVFAGVVQTAIYYLAISVLYSDKVVFYDRDAVGEYKDILMDSIPKNISISVAKGRQNGTPTVDNRLDDLN